MLDVRGTLAKENEEKLVYLNVTWDSNCYQLREHRFYQVLGQLRP